MNNLFETYSYGATESEKKIGVPCCLRITKMPLKMRKSNFQIKNSIFFQLNETFPTDLSELLSQRKNDRQNESFNQNSIIVYT